MSPTDVHDLADDAAERALRADAEQWQASHPAPSLDDAVRRLVAGDRTPARHRSGWWWPVAAAAAVLLLIGGAGEVAGPRRHTPPPSTTTAEPAPLTAGNLAVPDGFVEVSGHVSSPADRLILPYSSEPLRKTVRSWVSGRVIGTSRDPMPESLVLTVVEPAPGPAPSVSSTAPTAGSSVLPDGTATVTTVTWVAGGRDLALVYSGPAAGSADGRPLTISELRAIASTYEPGSSSTTRRLVHPAVPVTVAAGSTSLVLDHTRSFSARRGADGRLEVSLAGGPSALPGTANRCHPFEQAVLTGATATSVTVTVADYLPISGRDLPCTAEAYLGRWVPVALDGPLGARTVVDGSTGKPVTLSSSG